MSLELRDKVFGGPVSALTAGSSQSDGLWALPPASVSCWTVSHSVMAYWSGYFLGYSGCFAGSPSVASGKVSFRCFCYSWFVPSFLISLLSCNKHQFSLLGNSSKACWICATLIYFHPPSLIPPLILSLKDTDRCSLLENKRMLAVSL